MYDHIGLKAKDFGASVRFYAAALAPLGHVKGSAGDGWAGFGPPGEPGLWLYAEKQTGGRDNGAPGLRSDYSPTCYGAFLIDPDGNNVEAVCHAAA